VCGIVGHFAFDLANAKKVDLLAGVRAMNHRGPDDRGTLDETHRGMRAQLGHVRLSIIDLSPLGHQPMTSGNSNVTIVFNGEIYNHIELRNELEALGVRFRSHSDTEVIIASYEQWGTSCVSRFRGMFAFALWDRARRSVVLARDPFGVKPLYYTRNGDTLAFASEVRALLTLGVTSRRLSKEGLASHLAFGSPQEPHTAIEGVFALPAGTVMTVSHGHAETTSYFSLPRESHRVGQEEASDTLSKLLDDSIRLRLVADVEVGVFLSGGIDSSAVLARAVALGARPRSFTVSFDERQFDEWSYASAVAKHFGCPHERILLKPQAMLADIGSAFDGLDQPSSDGINTYFVSRAVRAAGLKVALSGIGGDEVFAGYQNFRRMQWLTRVPPFPAVNVLGRRAGGPVERVLGLLGSGDPKARYRHLRSMFSPSECRLLAPQTQEPLLSTFLPSSDALATFSRLEIEGYLRNTLLRDTDVMSMAHGLEVREPLLDTKLVEYVLSLPSGIKLSPKVNKPLLVFATGTLPKAATDRQKMGFSFPLEAWLKTDLQRWAAELVRDEAQAKNAGLDPAQLATTWDRFLAGKLTFARMWTLLTWQAWCRKHELSF
jgi:asparagine synthase (glutamine-hydrolysing)